MLHVWVPGGAWLPSPSPHALQRVIWSNANETFSISLQLKEGERFLMPD